MKKFRKFTNNPMLIIIVVWQFNNEVVILLLLYIDVSGIVDILVTLSALFLLNILSLWHNFCNKICQVLPCLYFYCSLFFSIVFSFFLTHIVLCLNLSATISWVFAASMISETNILRKKFWQANRSMDLVGNWPMCWKFI